MRRLSRGWVVGNVVSRRRAKRLYRKALADYRAGYIAGAQRRAVEDDGTSLCRLSRLGPYDPEHSPASSAGYEYGLDGVRTRMDRLPLDVWARVLAKALEP